MLVKRAVITGVGILSSIGNNKKEVLLSLKHAKSGITFSKEMYKSGMKSHVWGNIKLNINVFFEHKILRFMNDATIYSYLAMKEAIKDSGLSCKQYKRNPRVGLIIGSSGGSPRSQRLGVDAMRSKKGLRSVNPCTIIKSMTSSISANLSTIFNIYGVSYSISSACSSSAHCIGNALELIQSGKQDLIFAGGGEELTWEMAYQFDIMNALSTKYNHSPEKASRPYDVNRDGFVISGGAGVVIIEELNCAISRNANIYAEIIGYGTASDGFHVLLPSNQGTIRCIKNAILEQHDSIDYINAHATSTKIGDIQELNSIKKIFKNHIPYISSTKSITGHSLGSSGVHEVIYTLLMLQNNFISPSVNIQSLDPIAQNMNIVTNIIKTEMVTAMTNSFGFGGTNVTLILKKMK